VPLLVKWRVVIRMVSGALLTMVLIVTSIIPSSCASQEEGTGAGVQEGTDFGDHREDTSNVKGNGTAKAVALEPQDERQVVGGSSDVFFGLVIERTGSEAGPPVGPRGAREPQTQYAVEVTQIIKGDATGTITVNQTGGYGDDGSLEFPRVPGGDRFLEARREYLLATQYVEEKDWYQIVVPGAANIEVEDKAHREELERGYEEAYANQIEVNTPLPPATPEEVEERSYRHCWSDRSGPPGCDPSDPPPSDSPR
jgi:hypothetical protein